MILNLTQHIASEDQRVEFVVDLADEARATLIEALTFSDLPTGSEISSRCDVIYNLVLEEIQKLDSRLSLDEKDSQRNYIIDEKAVKDMQFSFMIGGAPYLMGPLAEELANIGTPIYAYSKRVSAETTKPDGSVVKTNVFKHLGFIPAVTVGV